MVWHQFIGFMCMLALIWWALIEIHQVLEKKEGEEKEKRYAKYAKWRETANDWDELKPLDKKAGSWADTDTYTIFYAGRAYVHKADDHTLVRVYRV